MPPAKTKFLGKGSNGSSVHRVTYIRRKNKVSSLIYAAVKTVECKHFESLQREIKILSKFKRCRNIVQCYENYALREDFDAIGFRVYKIAMEYASGGNLTTFMNRFNDRKLPESMIKDFTRMILQGLVSIHSQNYVHCDLKPDNLLIFPLKDSSYELKISDFKCSREVGKEDVDSWEFDYPYLGTPVYMSPESVHNGVAEKALDLWSLGCIVLEMYTGETPWSKVALDDLKFKLLEWNAPEIPTSIPCDARMFLETCFARKPEERGNASDLLMHRFLSGEQKMEKIVSEVVKIKRNQEKPLKNIAPKLSQFKKVQIKRKPEKPLIIPQFKKVETKPQKVLPPKPLASSFLAAQWYSEFISAT